MPTEKQLVALLDMLTEGAVASAAVESVRAEAATLRKAAKPWTEGKGIQGVGIGEKITDGEQLDEVVLKVYVDQKKPKSQLDNPVPKKVLMPGLDEEVSTDVEEIGRMEKEPNTARIRPAVPGFGVGHVDITVGTFGCLVRKKGQKSLYILSNSHVLADEGVAKIGDAIIQPGDFDGGKAPGDVIAELADWAPFQFTTTGYPNLVDAAIAKVKKAADVTSAVRLIGVPKGVSKFVRRGMQVQKTGRTTDYTVGVIKDINYRLALRYKKPGGGTGRVGLGDQVLCTRYTAGGDSGSAVFNMSGKVVGLHFAGSPSTSVFNRIEHVLSALDIELVTTKV
ncbi:MAG TPA: trypsin-like serine protease [Pirellulaceae bacterium]|nr:trypsin-like serine protease [Pirellulaceae bacterium]